MMLDPLSRKRLIAQTRVARARRNEEFKQIAQDSGDGDAERQRLNRREVEFTRAQEIAGIGSFTVDLTTGSQVWSDQVFRTLGLAPGEIPATFEAFIERVHPEDKALLVDKSNETFAGRGDLDHQYRIVRSDGQVRYVHTQANIDRGPDGKPAWAFGLTQDITERKIAEEKLRESELRFRDLVEANPYGIQKIDTSGVITYANPAYGEMLGYAPDELLGRSIMDLIEPQTRRDELSRYLSFLAEEQPEPTTYSQQNRTKDGRIVHMEVNWNYDRDDQGHVTGFTSVITDVTERTRAEEYRTLTRRVLELLNQPAERIDMIRDILLVIRELTGLEAVGIRLKQGEDFPYYHTSGFPVEFVEAENHLCARPGDGPSACGSEGGPHLECMCGNVICGRTDASRPYFTGRGGFWTNSTTALIASSVKNESLCYTRNRCSSTGYESVALIPLHADGRTVGLLQLNDSRENMFTLETIGFFEEIAASIGIGLARKDAEQEKGKLLSAIETAKEAINLTSAEGIMEYTNDAMDKLFGYERGELKGKHVSILNTSQEAFGCILTRLEEDGWWEGEVQNKRKDGTEFVSYASVSTHKDEEGRTLNFVCTQHDITEQRKAEQELRESEQRFRSLSEAAFEAIAFSENGILVDANEAFARMYRGSLEELVGRSAVELVVPEHKDVVAENIRSGFEGIYEVRGIRKDGSQIDLEICARSVIYQGRKMRMTALRDITDQKAAFEALRQSESKFRAIFETAANLITSVDASGVIVDCNNRIKEILGYEKDEIVGQSMAMIIRPDYLEQANEALRKILAGEISRDRQYKMVRKDGTVVDVKINSSLLRDPEGRGVRTICIIDDITERERAREKLLEYSEQLKSLASQLSMTEERERHRLATALHDHIGQSLVFSKLKLDLLRESALSEEVVGDLEEVANSIGRIIEDTRTLTFELSSPILYELGLEAAIAEWVKDEIEQKHGIEAEFEDDMKPKPLDDDIRTVLFRNVRELLVNVVKHSRAGKVRVSVARDDGEIRLSVEDNGVGFHPEEVTSNAARKAEFGLFSIRERLVHLGGSIQITSEPGHGCKVLMTAPLNDSEVDGSSEIRTGGGTANEHS